MACLCLHESFPSTQQSTFPTKCSNVNTKHGLAALRLAEKKAQIGYTYEDSTVTESDAPSEKGDEDNSENSESEEDEVIPDIGEPCFSLSFVFLSYLYLSSKFSSWLIPIAKP